MKQPRRAAGFTLLETLVALFLTALAVLAAAPMFIHAGHANDAGAGMGTVGSMAVDRLEQLRQIPWRDLDAGGSLATNVADFHDNSDAEFIVRWLITENASPTNTRTITILARSRMVTLGPRQSVEVTTVRAK